MSAPAIRRAGPADVPAIRACVEAAYAKWVSVLGYAPYPMAMDYDAGVRQHQVFVVPGETGVTGVIVLIDERPKLLLHNVAVDPVHQGRGLGDHLLRCAQALAARGGYETLRLYTNERMASNRAWYAARGFAEVAREVRPDRTIVFMERPVAADDMELTNHLPA